MVSTPVEVDASHLERARGVGSGRADQVQVAVLVPGDGVMYGIA